MEDRRMDGLGLRCCGAMLRRRTWVVTGHASQPGYVVRRVVRRSGSARRVAGHGREGFAVPVVRSYVGMGANLGDAPATLAWAVDRLGMLPSVRVRAVSRLYATRPVGVEDQPDFHNAAAALEVRVHGDIPSAALAFLERLKELEQQAGRRTGRRWGPRELDLDLLVFGRHVVHVTRTIAARSGDPARHGI